MGEIYIVYTFVNLNGFADFYLLMSLPRRTSAFIDHYHILYLDVAVGAEADGGINTVSGKRKGFTVLNFSPSISNIDIITIPTTSRHEELEIYG